MTYLCGLALLLALSTWLALVPTLHRPILQACIALTFVDVLAIHVGGVAVRPYQPVIVALLPCLVLAGPRKTREPRTPSALTAAVVAFSILCCITLAYSISTKNTVEVALGQLFLACLALCVAAAIRNGLLDVPDVLDCLLFGATLGSIVALLEFLVSYAGIHVGVDVVVGLPWHRPQGLMTEPDWGALAAGVGLLLSYFRSASRAWPWLGRNTVVAVNAIALILCGARATWISLLLTIGVLLLMRREVRARARRLLPAVGVIVVLFAAYASVNPGSLSRLSPNAVLSGVGDSGSANSRIGVIHLVLHSFQERPTLGYGAGTLAAAVTEPENVALYGGGADLNAGHGNANLELTLLWDGGLVMLALFAGLVYLWLRYARRQTFHPALFAVSLFAIIDFQFNNGIRLAYVWVIIGCAIVETKRRVSAVPASRSPRLGAKVLSG